MTVAITVFGDGDDQVLFVLPPDRWQTFCDALDAPPREIPALRKLLTEASLFDGNDGFAEQPSPTRGKCN